MADYGYCWLRIGGKLTRRQCAVLIDAMDDDGILKSLPPCLSTYDRKDLQYTDSFYSDHPFMSMSVDEVTTAFDEALSLVKCDECTNGPGSYLEFLEYDRRNAEFESLGVACRMHNISYVMYSRPEASDSWFSVNVVSDDGTRSARLIKADAKERIVYTKDQIQPLLDFFTHSNMTDGLAKLVAAKRRAQEIIDVSINDPPPLVIVE